MTPSNGDLIGLAESGIAFNFIDADLGLATFLCEPALEAPKDVALNKRLADFDRLVMTDAADVDAGTVCMTCFAFGLLTVTNFPGAA